MDEAAYPTTDVSMVETDGSVLRLYPASIVALWWDRILLAVVSPMLGLVGNAVSIILLTRTRLSGHPTSIYMTALAGVDFATIAIGTSIFELPRAMFNMQPTSAFYCRIGHYLVRVCAESANWILACMSVERCLAISMPLRAKIFIKKSRNIACIILSIVTIALVHSYNLFLYSHQSGICYIAYNKYFTKWIRYGIDYGFCILLPGAIIFGANLVIIVCMMRSNSKSLRADVNKDKIDSTTKSLVTMLISISIAYLVLKTPFHILMVLVKIDGMFYYTSTEKMAIARLGATITIWMQYFNNCINFYLYILSGREFRVEFLKMFCSCFRKDKNELSEGTEVHSKIQVTQA